MKAAVFNKYGSPEVVRIKDLPKPEPKHNEILIKVMASTMIAGDCEIRSFDFPFFMRLPIRLMFGIFRPRKKVLGAEVSGIIEKVGSSVTSLRPGQEVIAATGMRLGGHAEYVCLSMRNAIVPKPKNMTYNQAASIPIGGYNALHFIRKAGIQPGEHVLVIGAGGSIGTMGVQLAKIHGAKATAVDRLEKHDMLLSIGADHVIDFEIEDFTKNKSMYDVVLDIPRFSSFSGIMNVLKPGGRYLMANPSRFRDILKGIRVNRNRKNPEKYEGKKVIMELAGETNEALAYLVDLVESGKLKTVVDRTFSLDQIVDAHRYVETGMKQGCVVIEMKNQP